MTIPIELKYVVDKMMTNHEQKPISMQGSGYTDFLHGIHFYACSWLKQKIPDVNTALEITALTIIFHNFYYCILCLA